MTSEADSGLHAPGSAFDAVAQEYDRVFTSTPLARILRAAVWARLADHLRPGMRVLEIGCGTGEDAVWLARRGAYVIATDVSAAMLAVTRGKAESAGVADRVETAWLDAADPLSGLSARGPAMCADAALSNFGALNCIADLRPLASALARWIQPGGSLVLVFINRWCAWEIAWQGAHFRPRSAFRRLRHGGVEARVGEGTIQVWYPSMGSIRRAFAPAFRVTRITGLGVCLPPSYLEPIVARRPRLFRALTRLEGPAASTPLVKHLADHIILELERA